MENIEANEDWEQFAWKLLGVEKTDVESEQELESRLSRITITTKKPKKTTKNVMHSLQRADPFLYLESFTEPCTEEEARSIKDDHEWDKNIFVVPYTRGGNDLRIENWVDKAILDSEKYQTNVVLVIPNNTDTRWFHQKVLGKAEVGFVEGRIIFKGYKYAAQHGSILAIYKNDPRTVEDEPQEAEGVTQYNLLHSITGEFGISKGSTSKES